MADILKSFTANPEVTSNVQTRVNSEAALFDSIKDTSPSSAPGKDVASLLVSNLDSKFDSVNDVVSSHDIVTLISKAYSDTVFDYSSKSSGTPVQAPTKPTIGQNAFNSPVAVVSSDTRAYAGLSLLGASDSGSKVTTVITRSDALLFFKHTLSKYSSKFRGMVFHIACEDPESSDLQDIEHAFSFDSINPILISSSTPKQTLDMSILSYITAKLTNSCVFHLFNSKATEKVSSLVQGYSENPFSYENLSSVYSSISAEDLVKTNLSETLAQIFSKFNNKFGTSYSPSSFIGNTADPTSAFVSFYTSVKPTSLNSSDLFIDVSVFTPWTAEEIIAKLPNSVEKVLVISTVESGSRVTPRLYSDLVVSHFTLSFSNNSAVGKNVQFELLDLAEYSIRFNSTSSASSDSDILELADLKISDSEESLTTEPSSDATDSGALKTTEQPPEASLPIEQPFKASDLFEVQKAIAFKEAYGSKLSLEDSSESKEDLYSIKVTKYARLTPESYERNVFHIEFDTSESKLKYEIGDALGVSPVNKSERVLNFLEMYNVNPQTLVTNYEVEGKAATRTAFQWLKYKVDLFGRPGKKFYEFLAAHATDSSETEKLLYIASNAGKDEFIKRAEDTITYAELINEFTSARPSIFELIRNIPAIKQRHYSISSSSNMHPNKVHLLVVLVDWKANGVERFGLCTEYLTNLKVGDFVTVSVKPSAMKLPADDMAPVIMSGLGTGMAPFKAFIEERAYRRSKGIEVGPMALYFGSRSRSMEYLYAEDLESYNVSGILPVLRLAFSRDQKHKVYIQHKLGEDSALLYDWLVNKTGSFYLCGPTWPVQDVKNAIVSSLTEHGSIKPEKANKFIEDLKEKERYILECIRHLTMSTTDPSAAKPDSFAIGSISKRDRSGSGDEAAPVYPVKHPTMSYAGAAKGRKSLFEHLSLTG
ncbi:hypothetical protein BB560_003000 [Smittium megazygosporum]|uniref:assimilatory sulfite reductase (NADPH) n=1 Tax=Smittium megazygosporum TaxID=133381 RepID=A0A2T9ZD66_9FUNG|nr:hypothetical protein BB560_003000 [Smittium megazygosporum]